MMAKVRSASVLLNVLVLAFRDDYSTSVQRRSVRALSQIQKANLLDNLFHIEQNNRRNKCTIGPKKLGRVETAETYVSWRMGQNT